MRMAILLKELKDKLNGVINAKFDHVVLSLSVIPFSLRLSVATKSPTYMKYTARQYFKISGRNNTIVLSRTLQLVRRTTIKIQRTRIVPCRCGTLYGRS